jgi:hypothetical protein
MNSWYLIFLQLATWTGALALLGCASVVLGKNPRSKAALAALFAIIAFILLKIVLGFPSPLQRISGLFLLFDVLLLVYAAALGRVAFENAFSPVYVVLAIAAALVLLLTLSWLLPWFDIVIFPAVVHIGLRTAVVATQLACLVFALAAPSGRVRI